jgi:L-seryl-tRNA(Ser) seleniumtransferase
LSGAEAACVVNNNAAAVLLTLNTLALGREVIVSRGQLIEIGGSFRIPEVMQRSGAVMVEVGTTNKTHLHDYERAITERTAMLFAAHWSNYRILGFVKQVPVAELVELGRKHGLPVVHDLGGGVLLDLRQWGLPYEPVVREDIEAGVDVVTFSGDKVLGGPQCGIIVGKRDLVSEIRSNPLMRALRCDKMTFAALEPTLKLFLRRGAVPAEHPVLRMLTEPVEHVKQRAERLHQAIRSAEIPDVKVSLTESTAQTGSGALPLEEIPSWAVSLSSRRWSAEQLAAGLRRHEPPVIGYLREDLLHLDCRTLSDDEIDAVVDAVATLH